MALSGNGGGDIGVQGVNPLSFEEMVAAAQKEKRELEEKLRPRIHSDGEKVVACEVLMFFHELSVLSEDRTLTPALVQEKIEGPLSVGGHCVVTTKKNIDDLDELGPYGICLLGVPVEVSRVRIVQVAIDNLKTFVEIIIYTKIL